MYPAVLLIVTFLSLGSVNGEYSPVHHEQSSNYQHLDWRALKGRQEVDDLYCWVEDSICSIQLELNRDCGKFELISKEWYHCICDNGRVAAEEACNWCEGAHGEKVNTYIWDMYTSGCSSYSFTIAPLPSSIISRVSSLNATWTGSLLDFVTTGQEASTTGRSRTSTTRGTSALTPTGFSSSSELESEVRSTSSSDNSIFGAPTDTTTLILSGGGVFSVPTDAPTASGGSQSGSDSGSGAGAIPMLANGMSLFIMLAALTFVIMIVL